MTLRLKSELILAGVNILLAILFVMKWGLVKPIGWTFALIRWIFGHVPEHYQIGRVADTVVYLHVSMIIFIFTFGSLGWAERRWSGILLGELFLVSVFTMVTIHEFAHTLVAKSYGVKTPRIVLTPLGGMAEMDIGHFLMPPRWEFFITVAGPLSNAVIVTCMAPFFQESYTDAKIFTLPWFFMAFFAGNFLMLVFNLLPIFPMDGGRLLRSTLALRFAYAKATRWTCLVAFTLAPIVCLFGYYTERRMLFFIMPLVCLMSFAEVQRVDKLSAPEDVLEVEIVKLEPVPELTLDDQPPRCRLS